MIAGRLSRPSIVTLSRMGIHMYDSIGRIACVGASRREMVYRIDIEGRHGIEDHSFAIRFNYNTGHASVGFIGENPFHDKRPLTREAKAMLVQAAHTYRNQLVQFQLKGADVDLKTWSEMFNKGEYRHGGE
ncbi:hypothetical protein GR28A_00031 [Vibrio phage vB_VcorM_GR28A]|nr:hypothetical protein GR28A_00031 [Vibrio phage vB_VcorM_GR28A]